MDALNRIYEFDNGLVLLYEQMDWTEAFAIKVNVPGGKMWDTPELSGVASLTCEMTNRGADGFSNRAFLEKFENLGVKSSESAKNEDAAFAATGLIDVWESALELLAAQIRRPNFDEEEFDECRMIQLQELEAMKDEPKAKLEIALASILLPSPLSLPLLGTIETVGSLTTDDAISFYRKNYRPNGAIIAVAGRMSWEKVKEVVGRLFSDWSPKTPARINAVEPKDSKVHLESSTSQTHIALGYPEVPFGDPDYWRANVGKQVLSDGMSSRLFTELREKRGLCYSVGAVHRTTLSYGNVLVFCGTTAEKAQQSLDLIVEEIDKLSASPITESELARVKIQVKSDVVMQRESASRRVSAMIKSWKYFKTIRSIDEVLANYDGLTCEAVNSYYAEKGERKFKLATLGVAPLEIPETRLLL